MTIGHILKLLRTAAGLKQGPLADDLGVTVNYLSLVENGHKEPSLTFLKKFTARMNVPLGYLLWVALDENVSPDATELKNKMNDLLSMLVRSQPYGKGKAKSSQKKTTSQAANS